MSGTALPRIARKFQNYYNNNSGNMSGTALPRIARKFQKLLQQ